jgi:hypothetical protein
MSESEETSDMARLTDSTVNRAVVNLPHHLWALIAVWGAFTHEAAVQQGRRGVSDVDERTVRAGAVLSHLPTKPWTVSASDDVDPVKSGDRARERVGHRGGVGASDAF